MAFYLYDGAALLVAGGIAAHVDCCCGECLDCCDDRLTEYVVDLGAGGLTNDHCDNCAAIAGEFTVAWEDADTCFWMYGADDWCDGCVFTHNLWPSGGGRLDLVIVLRLLNGCKWQVTVQLTGTGVDPPSQDDLDEFCEGQGFRQLTQAVYEGPGGVTDCDAAALPVTLTKVSEWWGGECNGTLPATIQLEAV